ncbi:MAG: LpqB family beta-propeller domain-containing protein [Actinomycetota bacterium]|nr:LpqB family beta-propeller domain-containing protein [Actinomycetota bacterium]
MKRRSALAAVSLALLLFLVGCAGIPSSGEVHDVQTIGAAPSQGAPVGPISGQEPDLVVHAFIEAAADTTLDAQAGKRFGVARQYLTTEASDKWQVGDASTPVIVLRDAYRADRGADDGSIKVSGTQIATLDAGGAYHAVAAKPYAMNLKLTKVKGEWRIENPPADLLITTTNFGKAYNYRTLYFLNSTGTVLVPDRRYLIVGATAAVRAGQLVDLLFRGPSSSLQQVVTSRLGAGVKLQSNVTVDDPTGDIRVALTNVDPSPPARQQLAAQLAFTLQTEGNVVITIDGQQLGTKAFTVHDTQSFSPEQIPAGGPAVPLDPYYTDAQGRIVSLQTGQAMWGRLGHSGGVQSAAMSAANGTLAAVATTETGQELLIGRPLEYQNAVAVLPATTLTTPSFDRSGDEVWVVQDGATNPKVLQLTTSTPTGRQVVDVPGLTGQGPVTALALSPDGVRVAIVAGHRLYVGVIVSQPPDSGGSSTTPPGSGGGSPTTSITGLVQIDPSLTNVGPIAFSSADGLLVGAKVASAVFVTLHQVSIDGSVDSPLTDTNITGDVTDIAVGNGQILVGFDGRVWKLDGSQSTGAWVSPDPQSLVVEGSTPFLPN